jgi:hypothetical protein
VVLEALEHQPEALQILVVPAASVVLGLLVDQLELEDLEALLARSEALQASVVLAVLVDPLALEEKQVPPAK